MKSWLANYIERLGSVLAGLDLAAVARAAEALAAARDHGRRVFLCGNGGGFATASHLAVDLGKGATLGRAKGFAVTNLGECLPLMTALANDVSYEAVFAEALRPQAHAGDVLVAISVSGNSPNIVRAAELARELGLSVIALVGGGGNKLTELADVAVTIGETHYGRVEDVQMIVCHMLAYAFIDNVVPEFGKLAPQTHDKPNRSGA